MPDFMEMYKSQKKWLFYLLSFYVIGWGFTSYQSIFLGLILGTSFSFFNLWLMAKKSKDFDKAIARGKKIRSLGSTSRMATAAIAMLIGLKYPENFNLISLVVGLMTVYIVIPIHYFFQSLKPHK
jgi:ATP synthase protein I